MVNNFEKNVLSKLDEFDRKFKDNDKFQKNVYERFDKIDKKFEKMDKKFDTIDKKFDSIDIRFEKIENILLSMQQTIEKMNKSIILIEHKVSTEIPALFDGYSMHQEKQEFQQENIDSLNIKVEEHDIRISSLEQAKF